MFGTCHLQSQCNTHLPPYMPLERLKQQQLSQALAHPLDRVNVLGDDRTSGHTGCVNALSWARSGELLLSGGDDTTVRIWGIDAADTTHDFPFVCRSVIHTGHTANIFSTQMLPFSTRIATVAGDHQIRVFDIGDAALAPTRNETSYTARQALTHKLRCHEDRVKRIVTEYSPDLFLTVSEDGTVRQHDLRIPHDCRHAHCPAPLVKVNHELSTLSLSPLTPHQFIVAGESPYGYLFDRRHVGRNLRIEWGLPEALAANSSLTTCVRRFGKPTVASPSNSWRRRSEHITGARMSASNGHEVILSYSGDSVYLYSTYDNPSASSSPQTPSLLPSNTKRRRSGSSPLVSKRLMPDADGMDADTELSSAADISSNISQRSIDDESDDLFDHEHDLTDGDGDDDDDDDEDEDYAELEDTGQDNELEINYHPDVPVVLPRQRYVGARNVATIKDVNFLGPKDELVASGSDDGNFFIWRKATGVLHGIYEGDSSVVNMIEGHPHLPLVAISGIDYTVKLFAPSHDSQSEFSKIENAANITQTNSRLSRPPAIRYGFATLLAQARLASALSDEPGEFECRNQ